MKDFLEKAAYLTQTIRQQEREIGMDIRSSRRKLAEFDFLKKLSQSLDKAAIELGGVIDEFQLKVEKLLVKYAQNADTTPGKLIQYYITEGDEIITTPLVRTFLIDPEHAETIKAHTKDLDAIVYATNVDLDFEYRVQIQFIVKCDDENRTTVYDSDDEEEEDITND